MASMAGAELLGKALKTCGIRGALYHTGDESGGGIDYKDWAFVLRQYYDKSLSKKYNIYSPAKHDDVRNKVFFTPLGFVILMC